MTVDMVVSWKQNGAVLYKSDVKMGPVIYGSFPNLERACIDPIYYSPYYRDLPKKVPLILGNYHMRPYVTEKQLDRADPCY